MVYCETRIKTCVFLKSYSIITPPAETAFGVFIQPPPRFAGTPGKANCYGQTALTSRFGGLNGAASALGYFGASARQDAILTFCRG